MKSMIPFIDLSAQYTAYQAEIDKAITEVLRSTRFIGGPIVEKLESELADYTGAAYCVACGSGTDALILSLLALGLQPGDEVITTPFSFFATGEAIGLLGGTPIFADIEDDTYNICPRRVEERISERTKGIIAVSIFGQPPDMGEINRVAAARGLWVIEDAAQSFGATYKGKKSCHLSTVGCTSFFPSKPLGCYGDGGAVFTDSKDFASRLVELRNHGSTATYVHNSIGLNARLDALQAAILRIKLKHMHEELDRRRRIAAIYNEAFEGEHDLVLPTVSHGRTSVYAQYSLRLRQRDRVFQKLKEIGIPVAIHYPRPIYKQKAFSHLSIDACEYPVVERICTEIMSIPICAFLTEENQSKVIHELKAIVHQ